MDNNWLWLIKGLRGLVDLIEETRHNGCGMSESVRESLQEEVDRLQILMKPPKP